MGRESPHFSINDRTFLRAISGPYNLHDELNCVHQHFSADPQRPARALVIKSKPMYMFMNMLFQKRVISKPKETAPGAPEFAPRQLEDDYNHED